MTQTELPALKPCPFCGTPDPEYDNCDRGSGQWYSCRGCPVIVKVPYREDLAAAWNRRALMAREAVEVPPGCHGLDTPERVRFYEHDFYVLSNFSAFTLVWKGIRFDTSEAAYHFEKFSDGDGAMADVRAIQWNIRTAPSAHEAFKIAERNKAHRRPDWDQIKVGVMRDILRAKAEQHEYVRRKLLATGDRELVEDSWRDDFWGWGPNRDGQNMLGKLWMEVRAELRTKGQL